MSYGHLNRTSRAARSVRIEPEPGEGRRVFRFADIERGWLVEDNTGRRVGSIRRCEGTDLVVSPGFLRSELRLPATLVRGVREGVVTLNVIRATLESRR